MALSLRVPGAEKQGGEVLGTQLNVAWVERIGGEFSEFFVGDKSSSVKHGEIIVFSKDDKGDKNCLVKLFSVGGKEEGWPPETRDAGI